MTGIAMLPFLYFSNLNLLNVLPGLLLTILYWLPLMPVRLFKRSGIFKTILLAFTWACVTVYMPLNLSLTDITAAAWFVLIRRFLFMLILCIIFDNRDSAIDKIRGIKSLSTEISVAAIRYIVAVVFLILMAIILWYNYFGITTRQAVALLPFYLLIFFLQKNVGITFIIFWLMG
jgi:4-hydroxybenzoate polyprenyltransferase